jgi:hypothetical protein
VPITSDNNGKNSPSRIIRQIATKDDFVAFKLDIDTPDIEIPILIDLLTDPQLLDLVDEFFFEMHFRCEVMMYCGWSANTSEESHGIRLYRDEVLKIFSRLRHAGVRSHFWP